MYTSKELKSIFSHYIDHTANDIIVEQVFTDSRKQVSNGLFIPLKGENFDAHNFIEGALQQGAVASLWNKDIPIPSSIKDKIIFFLVDDTLEALQELAAHYRQKINPIVIGVTGSNGKTSTKDLLKAAFKEVYCTAGTEGNYNNHIGLPLTILSMTKETELLILEMGMSNYKEIELLSTIAKPDYAIITNIGESHIEHLGSREGIAQAKLEILEGLQKDGQLIIDGDEPLLLSAHNKNNVITCGEHKHNKFVVESIKITDYNTSFTINEQVYTIPLIGAHHAKNAAYVIAIASILKIKKEVIQDGFNHIQYSNMRFERINGKNGVTIINDAYNASPTSMKAAIEVIKQFNFEHKVIVLGDILELGPYSEKFHRSIASVLDSTIQYVFLIGNEMQYLYDELLKEDHNFFVQYFTTENKALLVEELKALSKNDTVILLKGSRGMALETIVEKL